MVQTKVGRRIRGTAFRLPPGQVPQQQSPPPVAIIVKPADPPPALTASVPVMQSREPPTPWGLYGTIG
jgi:hypothetical protein